MTEPTPPSDRRRAPRQIACFPAYVERDDSVKGTAMMDDLSATGARLLVRGGDLHPGEELHLQLFVSLDESKPTLATAKVVRVEPLPDERVSLWTHQVAVAFAEPLAVNEEEVARIRERMGKLGLKR